MSSSPWIERLTSLPVVAAIAVPAYALAVFTWVDTGWAPLAASEGWGLAYGVAASIGFGYAMDRWWATLGGLLIAPAALLLRHD